MNALVLTHRLPFAPNRGDRIRAYHLLRLLETTHHVRLVSLVHDAEEDAQLSGMRERGTMVTGVRVSPIRNHALALASLPGRRPLTHSLLHGVGIHRILEQEGARRPDVLVAYGTGMMRHAFSPALRDVPCVLDMVDVDSEKWNQLSRTAAMPMRWIYRREARTLRAFERRAMRHARATVVVSERERQVALEMLGHNPEVVPNGVDLQQFAPEGPPADSRNVVFCGVFNYQPNEDAAVWLATQVWPRVKMAEPGARLQLVGMNPSKTVRSLAQPDSVEVTGTVADVRPYLWGAAVAVAPLLIARGVQNKVLEAVAAGLPVVVSAAVFQGLPVRVGAACESHDDPTAFANAVVRLIRTPASARRALAATACLDELTWPRQLSPVLQLLDQAAMSAPPLRHGVEGR